MKQERPIRVLQVIDSLGIGGAETWLKLEPLFGRPGHTFLLMDLDTVLAGPVLDLRAQSDAPFFVDDEKLPEADSKRLYYDWERLSELDPNVQSAQRAFNSGQWFGTAGLLTREDFDPWINWTMPRTLRYPEYFMGGEQAVLNPIVALSSGHCCNKIVYKNLRAIGSDRMALLF
jgi:hypothetical protein